MSVTILETLENADCNLQQDSMLGLAVAKSQIHNAVVLLRKGYDLEGTEVEPLLTRYVLVENVPEYV